MKLKIQGAKIILRSEKIRESPTLKMLGLAAGCEEPLEEALMREVEDKIAREKVPSSQISTPNLTS